ncbi:MAG: PDZ domain-containing protein [Bacteroidales bacterium]|nr:PDZ domain-containing protein [Bacteroidales bacterium]MCF8404314.1 PDZ domain-containing protein [Bacteroidales bacterium]
MKQVLFLIALSICLQLGYSQDEARLLRFPTIHNNQVIFSYAGDLYTCGLDGGIARKLTNDDGYEMFARFSPNGQHVAFTAQYDGNTEVYLMDANGSKPVRLTYTATLGRDDISDRMGPNNIVMSWKDNENIVYRSRKQSFNSFKGQLFLANINGGLSEELPLPAGGFCSYSPDGKKLAYNRVFREFRTWKYYKGGMADDVWIYDFKTKETINITNNEAQDIIPMWIGNEIYFLSDRDRTMNLFAYNLETGETRKVTQYTNYDIKFPSAGNNSIIYENGGYLYNFNIETQQANKINIQIAEDLYGSREVFKDASKSIDSWAISPDGKRLAFGARGDVWTVPAEHGMTRNLTESSGIHDRNVEWSPDGKYISYISDRTGEDEIYIQNQDGTEAAIKITSNSSNYKYNPIWSPDSKKLLWSDRNQNLQYVNVETKEITLVEHSPDGELGSYNWSPDSKWITYPLPAKEEMTRIWVYNLDTKEKNAVTDGWYSSGNPSFSSNGDYLFFSSSRDFNPIYSWVEWNHAYQDMQKLYFVTLRKDVENPFQPVNDEVEIKEEKKEEPKKEDDKKPEADKETITIDFNGIIDRILDIPGKAGYYYNISCIDNSVYYCMGNSKQESTKLMLYDLKKLKETEIGEYGSYIISADNKKMVINDKDKYGIIDLPKGNIKLSDFVDLSNMKALVNLKEEWNQIYNEAWRQMRDFFYDPGMHGVDWKAIHTKYEPLVPWINDRNDLNYIIGEMIGELSVGHAYISGGDKPSPERIKTGLLGARLSRDASGYYRIDKILKGENWTSSKKSPLTEVGVDVKEGDFITAVNGKPTNKMKDIYESLVGKARVQVELTINAKATEGGRKIIIEPISDESKLYYYNWVQNNIEKVSEATDGQVGYIHIPDMSAQGLNEFIKYYYPQLRKKALIIDDRGNGGGNVSPMIIERLRRELTLMRVSRNGTPYTSPAGLHYGPKVMLIDKYSASDGDLFPYQFKTLNMGTIIGTRSWGGVVGIRGSLPFIDGGDLRKPEFSSYHRDGSKFVIEGYGVDPDIELENDPAKEYEGIDEQLNKAIQVALDQLKEWPEDLPGVPEYPDKSK